MVNYSRRELLKKAAYVGPVIVTLPAVPSFAQTGSGGSFDCSTIQFGQDGLPLPGQDPELLSFCFPSS